MGALLLLQAHDSHVLVRGQTVDKASLHISHLLQSLVKLQSVCDLFILHLLRRSLHLLVHLKHSFKLDLKVSALIGIHLRLAVQVLDAASEIGQVVFESNGSVIQLLQLVVIIEAVSRI